MDRPRIGRLAGHALPVEERVAAASRMAVMLPG
jgi:hypothetical protein